MLAANGLQACTVRFLKHYFV